MSATRVACQVSGTHGKPNWLCRSTSAWEALTARRDRRAKIRWFDGPAKIGVTSTVKKGNRYLPAKIRQELSPNEKRVENRRKRSATNAGPVRSIQPVGRSPLFSRFKAVKKKLLMFFDVCNFGIRRFLKKNPEVLNKKKDTPKNLPPTEK
jgi:hypothetical protein